MSTLELVPRPRLPHLGFYSLRLSRVPAPTLAFSILLVSLGLAAATDGANANSPAAASKRLAGLSAGEDVDLRVLDWTLWNISKYYVDPSRIDPQRMTMAGIEALELALPEILCEQLDHGKRVRVRVGTNQQEFPTDVQALWAVRTHLRAIFGYVQKHVKLDDEKRSAVE